MLISQRKNGGNGNKIYYMYFSLQSFITVIPDHTKAKEKEKISNKSLMMITSLFESRSKLKIFALLSGVGKWQFYAPAPFFLFSEIIALWFSF